MLNFETIIGFILCIALLVIIFSDTTPKIQVLQKEEKIMENQEEKKTYEVKVQCKNCGEGSLSGLVIEIFLTINLLCGTLDI